MADLAKQVARDARRLIAGKLSEAEFYQRYHQAYLKEFGVDDRPIDSGRGTDRRLPESVFEKYISRRTLLKLGGLGVAGLVVGRWLGGSRVLGAGAAAVGDNYGGLPLKGEDQSQPAGRVQMGMVIDLEACDGCLRLSTV